MNWANIGKKLVKAKELGKDLNKISLGKYEPTTKAKRDKLAKGVKSYRKAGHKETAKKFAKNPEQFRGPKTFLTHDEQKKMGTSGQYWLGPRKTKNPSDYRHGGKVRLPGEKPMSGGRGRKDLAARKHHKGAGTSKYSSMDWKKVAHKAGTRPGQKSSVQKAGARKAQRIGRYQLKKVK